MISCIGVFCRFGRSGRKFQTLSFFSQTHPIHYNSKPKKKLEEFQKNNHHSVEKTTKKLGEMHKEKKGDTFFEKVEQMKQFRRLKKCNPLI